MKQPARTLVLFLGAMTFISSAGAGSRISPGTPGDVGGPFPAGAEVPGDARPWILPGSPGVPWAWGSDGYGQLGNGSGGGSYTPVPVSLPAGSTFTMMDSGYYHGLGLTDTGTLVAWGWNLYGQVGDGTTTNRTAPVTVSIPAGTTITAIAAGSAHSLAVTSTGQVLAWGSGSLGALGNGANGNSSAPVWVSLPAGVTVTDVAAGDGHSLALTSDGRILGWGFNTGGQLGNGTWSNSNVPVWASLPAGTLVTKIFSGCYQGFALTSTGTVLGWGHNAYGELGDGTNTYRNTPTVIPFPVGTTITDISGGNGHSVFLTGAGTVLATGYNAYGQLGNGTLTDSNVPVAVSLPAGAVITDVEANQGHCLARMSTGTALAWGRNQSGQLGDGTNSNRNVPVDVLNLKQVLQLAAGVAHSCATTIPCPTITVGNPAVTTGQAGVFFSQAFIQSGGTDPTTYSLASGSLPAGFTLASDGTLSGTTTQAGTFPITVTATDTNSCTGTGPTYTLVISAQADLAVTKTDNPDPATAGQNLTYTVNLDNNGPSDAQTVTVTDAVPADTTFVSAAVTTGAGWATSAPAVGGTGNVVFSKPAVAAGEAAVFTIVVHVGESVPDGSFVTNSAVAATATSDPAPGNNTATATTAVVAQADLAVTKSDAPDPVTAEQNLTYTVNFVNNGPSDAQTVTVTDAVPANTTFVSATVTTGTGWATSAPAVGGMGNVVFSKPTVAAGETAVFTLVVRVDTIVLSGSTVTNAVTAASATTDPIPGNNSAVAHTLVVCPGVTVSPSSLAPGMAGVDYGPVNFTQAGGVGAVTWSATGTLPPGLTLETTGLLHGTPTTGAGSPFTFTVMATDANGCTGSQVYSLAIDCPTVVTNLDDAGEGSLRWTVANACDGSTLTFAPGLTGVIHLTSGAITNPVAVTLNGPGASLIAVDGGGLDRVFHVGGFLAISGLTIRNGATSGPGGGIHTNNHLELTDCVISENEAGAGGGGIYANSSLIVTRCTISGNRVTGSGNGGGILQHRVLCHITDSTVSGNSCPGNGGGIEFFGGGDYSQVDSCTVTLNTAGPTSSGAGIEAEVEFPGIPVMVNLKNTLVAGNGPGVSQVGTSVEAYVNFQGNNITSGDPLLAPLGDYGGPTPTHALICGSPALDAASPGSFEQTDQRLVLRPQGAGGDVGAFEANVFLGPAGLPGGHPGTAYDETLTATGGTGPYLFTTADTLPPGLSLALNGQIAGTPTALGSWTFLVSARDANGFAGVCRYTLDITCPTITVTNPAVATGTAGTPFSQAFTQTGGIGTAAFTTGSLLPAGLTLAADGTLSGTPTVTGSFPITVTVTDANGCTGTGPVYTLVINCQAITVTNPATATGTAGTPFSQTFTQTGGIGTAAFTTGSLLPAGLTLAADGTLSGTPTVNGTFPITVQVTDANGCTGVGAVYNLVLGCDPLSITATFPQQVCAGQPATLAVSVSGAGPFTYRWFRSPDGIDFTEIPGATGASFTSPALTVRTVFKVEVTGLCDSGSNIMLVEVSQPPVITGQSTGPAIGSHQSATLFVDYTGTEPVTVQWYEGTAGDTALPVEGATEPIFQTPSLTRSTRYWARLTNDCGQADSSEVPVEVFNEYYLAHVTAGNGWWTGIHLVCVGPDTHDVTFEAVSSEGVVLETKTLSAVMPMNKLTLAPADLFSPATVGQDLWVRVSSPSELQVMEEFGTTDHLGRAALPAMTATDAGLCISFPYVVALPDWYTGITLVNRTPAAASTRLEAFGEDGVKLAEVLGTLAGQGKYARLIDGLFPGVADPTTIRMIRVTADQPLLGFELFGGYSRKDLAGLPAVRLDEEHAKGFFYGMYLQEIPDNADWYTGVTFANLDVKPALVMGDVYDSAGRKLGNETWALDPGQQMTREIWGLLDPAEYGTAAYLLLGSYERINGFELLLSRSTPFSFDGLPAIRKPYRKFYFPLTAVAGGATSVLRLVNKTDAPMTVQVKAYGADGALLATYPAALDDRAKLDLNVGEIFAGAAADTAWLLLEGDNVFTCDAFILAPGDATLVTYPGLGVN